MSPLNGKCALVTGSVQGLGLAVSRRLAAAGCHLVLSGHADEPTVAGLRRDLEEAHQVRTLYSPANLRHPQDIARMVEMAGNAFGHVDILVNNAVVRHAAPIDAFPTEAWDEALAVNLSAAFHTIRLTLPGMKTRNWGRIVNVSSRWPGQRLRRRESPTGRSTSSSSSAEAMCASLVLAMAAPRDSNVVLSFCMRCSLPQC
jgi:3-hydroxybutyrate dehydrogenase